MRNVYDISLILLLRFIRECEVYQTNLILMSERKILKNVEQTWSKSMSFQDISWGSIVLEAKEKLDFSIFVAHHELKRSS